MEYSQKPPTHSDTFGALYLGDIYQDASSCCDSLEYPLTLFKIWATILVKFILKIVPFSWNAFYLDQLKECWVYEV